MKKQPTIINAHRHVNEKPEQSKREGNNNSPQKLFSIIFHVAHVSNFRHWQNYLDLSKICNNNRKLQQILSCLNYSVLKLREFLLFPFTPARGGTRVMGLTAELTKF